MVALASSNPDVLSVQFRKIFSDAFNMIPSRIGDFAKVMTSDRAYEDYSQVSGFGDISTFSGKLTELDVYQGYDTRFDHKEYGNKFVVERKLLKDDQYNVYSQMPRNLGIAAKRTREKDVQQMYVDSFTTAMSSTSGGGNGDALSLCNTAHTSTVPGVANQSNQGSTALSSAAVSAARLAMRKFTGPEGEKIATNPTLLVVPPDLEETAWTIVNSKGNPAGAGNDANFNFQKWSYVVLDYASSTTDWWLVDPVMRDMSAYWFDREQVQFLKDRDFDTLQLNFAVYWRHSRGWVDYRWIYGSDV